MLFPLRISTGPAYTFSLPPIPWTGNLATRRKGLPESSDSQRLNEEVSEEQGRMHSVFLGPAVWALWPLHVERAGFLNVWSNALPLRRMIWNQDWLVCLLCLSLSCQTVNCCVFLFIHQVSISLLQFEVFYTVGWEQIENISKPQCHVPKQNW